MVTLYASFPDAANGEKALGALLDHGAQPVDLAAFFPYECEAWDGAEAAPLVSRAESSKAADAGLTVKRKSGGREAGPLARLLSGAVPGLGLVTGGGALASVVGSTVRDALTGGAGFLQDQGLAERIASNSELALRNGEAVLVVKSPSGTLIEELARDLLLRYDGNIFGCIEQP